ncbi:MAG: hypothetical protein ACI9F2_000143 [Lysobacterales bacterium]|jgi:hypothetical protein
MKKMLYKSDKNLEKKTKTMQYVQEIEEHDSTTIISKQFEYRLEEVEKTDESNTKPNVNIVKTIDSVRKLEKLDFEVRGSFFITYQRKSIKVNFKHKLNVKIYWKNDNFSPKKSAVLTK